MWCLFQQFHRSRCASPSGSDGSILCAASCIAGLAVYCAASTAHACPHTPAHTRLPPMLPRNGFLRESCSCPRIGPGYGRSHYDRFGSPFKSESPDGVIPYDLPPVESYRACGASPAARMGPGFGLPCSPRTGDLAPRGAGALVQYDDASPFNLGRINTAPKLGPGHGRGGVFAYRDLPMAPPGSGAGKLYALPEPEAYKLARQPRHQKWDPAYARFPKTRRQLTDAQYTLPDAKVYLQTSAAYVATLGRPGPRIDPKQYRGGQGADKLYTIPNVDKYQRDTSSKAHTFAPPVVRHEVGARQSDVPIKIPSPEAPTWLARLSEHKPRPREPWAKPKARPNTGPSPGSSPSRS